MADQSVRIENMPVPATHQAVALELWRAIRYNHSKNLNSIDAELALYKRCLAAAFNKADPGA